MMPKKDDPDPIDKHVGSRVRMRRLTLGLSQTRLGEASGISFQQVQKYEKGTNRISSSRLQQISNILQVPVSFFFEEAPRLKREPHGNGDAPSPAYLSEFLAMRHGHQLMQSFMLIPDAKLRRRVVDLVEQLATGE
jgi:transcriptional regulator with XRE-family HTH domain